MSQNFERRLAEALASLDQGQDIQTVLAMYPDVADELAPLLETAIHAREVLDYFEPPSAAGLAAGRRRMLEAAARKDRGPFALSTQPWWQPVLAALGQWFRTPARGLATAALLLALFLAVSGATVVAAADSLPGDPLYPVKRITEQVRLTLTIDPAARAALHAQLNRERQAEARAVASMGRRAQLRFEGRLERRMDGVWVVDGIELVVDPETVEGTPAVGSVVIVDVVSPGDGTLRVKHMAMHGTPHRPGQPEAPGPRHERRTAPPSPEPSATPTTEHRQPTTMAPPTEHPTHTAEPPMPMPTDDMAPGQPHRERHPSPTHGPMMGPMMGQPTATPPPTATGAPAQPEPMPTQAPPTHMPTAEPTHPGPMMPHPTQEPHPGPPHPTMPPGGGHGGGGHPGGPGGGHRGG